MTDLFLSPKQKKAKKVVQDVAKGAASNSVGTFATLPLIQIFTARQTEAQSTSTYAIAKRTLTPKGLVRAYSASTTFIVWAPLRSAAYLGVSNAVFEHYKDEEGLAAQLKKGVMAGCSSAFAESLVDAWGLPKALAKWSQPGEASNIHPQTAFIRCYRASLLKNTVANSMTLSVVYVVKQVLAENSSVSPAMQPAVAGLLGPAVVGLGIAPFVYLESNTAKNPQRTMSQHLKDIIDSKAPLKMWNGAGTRIVQRSIASAITFFTLEQINLRWQQAERSSYKKAHRDQMHARTPTPTS